MSTQSNKDKEAFLGGFKKLFKEQWQADVRLKAGDSDESAAISAHKFVLAARSQVFKKMLESDECKTSAKLETVTFSEMKHEEVEALVEFMYSVDGSISSESLEKHARSLYLAADKYEIPHLRNLCRKHLISSLNSSNALSILELAQVPLDKLLNAVAFAAIKVNIVAIATSSEFKRFVANHPNLAVEIMKTSLTRTAMATQSNLEVFLGGFSKILNELWQVDLRLKAGGSKRGAAISAHKLVLAARSEVFKKMLESDKLKSPVGKIETVTLSELKQEELEALVEFIYSNGSALSAKEKKHVQSLYIVADKYEILHLRDLCRNELISSLNTSNALNVLELSLIPFDKALYDSAVVFVIRNLLTISDTVEFKLFVGRNPDLTVEIIKSSQTRRRNGHYV